MNHKIEIIIIFLFGLLLCLSGIWLYPITILDEAKNAEAAREMFFGNQFLPTFNDILRTDKPPLHYFFMQIGYKLFGVNAFAARFFGALLGAGFMTYFYVFLRKHIMLNVARLVMMILFSSVFWIQEFHLAVPDPFLLVFLCSSWLFFYDYWNEKDEENIQAYQPKNNLKLNDTRFNLFQNLRKRTTNKLFLFYTFVGLATLSKGPVAIGLTGLIVLLFLIVQKKLNLKTLLSFKPIHGGLLVLLIAMPWFLWIHFKTDGAFTQGFFVEHNIERFGNEKEGHGGIFLLTWVFVLLGVFPFGAFMLQGLWHGWKFREKHSLIYFSLVVNLVVIGFFSISSTKLPNYTLPAIPFLAILIAGFLEEISIYQNSKNWRNGLSIGLISLVSLAIPIAVYILFENPTLKQEQILYAILLMIIVLLGLSYIWIHFLRKKDVKWMYGIAVLWVMISVVIFFFIYPNLSKIEPVMMAKDVVNDNKIVVYKNYDPAFNFNYQKTYQVFEKQEDLIKYLNKNPKTLVLTKDKIIQNDTLINTQFQIIFNQPSIFENYRTLILKKW